MVTKTSTTSNAPAADTPASVSSASATSTATASSTVVASTPSPTPSDCLKTTPSGGASPSSVDVSPDDSVLASHPRFSRVSPVVLQSVKAITYRKSCLKRSTLSVLPLSTGSADGKPAKNVAEMTEVKVQDMNTFQKNRRRCWQCRAKVGLTAVKCRCDYTFCGKHRYAEEHNCAFNFKTAGKRKLQEENPVVVSAKVSPSKTVLNLWVFWAVASASLNEVMESIHAALSDRSEVRLAAPVIVIGGRRASRCTSS
ncbi:putative Zinc finger, AN1-type, AN1-like Zinc finger [Plasmopara halstedii]